MSNSTAVVPFQFHSHEIRTLNIKDEPWFVGIDVCRILGLTNMSVAIQSLDDDERAKFSLGRQGKAWIINESGLFALILRSNKPEARVFRKWVTSEVLPAIHRSPGIPGTDFIPSSAGSPSGMAKDYPVQGNGVEPCGDWHPVRSEHQLYPEDCPEAGSMRISGSGKKP